MYSLCKKCKDFLTNKTKVAFEPNLQLQYPLQLVYLSILLTFFFCSVCMNACLSYLTCHFGHTLTEDVVNLLLTQFGKPLCHPTCLDLK